MPESSHRHTSLLFLALALALVLCIALLWNLAVGGAMYSKTSPTDEPTVEMANDGSAPGEAPASPAAETPSSPESPAPARGRLALKLPANYTPLLPCPLVFEFATQPSVLHQLQPLQAIVASFNAQADAPLEKWLLEQKALEKLREIQENHTIDRQRIYLIAHNAEGLHFAALHAANFNALFLKFTQDLTPDDWKDLPLVNLANLAVYLDTSELAAPALNVRSLAKALRQHQTPRVLAPECPLALTVPALPQALSSLSLYLNENQDIIKYKATTLSNGTCQWFRFEEFDEYGRPGEITAQIRPAPSAAIAKLALSTKNLNAFSIQRTWRDFHDARTFLVEVDGQSLTIPNRSGTSEWLTIRRVGEVWQANAPAPEPPSKTVASEGPIAAIFLSPFVIVWGSQDPDTAELWKKSAEALARKCQALTGDVPPCLEDSQCTPEHLNGKSLILLGSPRENLLVGNLMEDDSDFLRQIYQKDPRIADQMETNEELPMCCITLYPSDIYTQNKRALAIIADAPEFIPEAWKPLFTEEALKADYLLFQPGEENPRASGFCTPDWQIGEWR